MASVREKLEAAKSQFVNGERNASAAARACGIHKRTAQRIFARLKAGKSAETGERLGRPLKLTPSLRRQLAQYKAKHPFKNAAWYARQLSLRNRVPISVRSTRRALHELGFHWRVPKRRLLTSAQKRARVEFARAHLADSWERRMAGDETTFNLWRSGKKCWVRLSNRTGEDYPNKPYIAPKLEKISVTVVAAIGRGRKSDIGFLPKGWAGDDLVSVFDRVVFPSLQWRSSIHKPDELMWDNDGRHHQKVWKDYAARRRLRPLDPWPSNSPDLSPIENLWRWMKDRVESSCARNEAELREAIRKAWLDFPIENTITLMDSMPKRLAECLRLNGGRIRY